MRKYVIAICLAFLLLSGCTRLVTAVKETTPEQVQVAQTQIQPMIPEPYKVPVSLGLGWFACVMYNLLRTKKEVENAKKAV